MPPQPPKSVIIVGGSLAGLMQALTLLSLPSPPPSIRILERSPTNLLHNQGAGIVVGAETQKFFDEVVKPGREIAVASPKRHYLDREGDIIPQSVELREQRMTSWGLLYNLLRWRVDGLESEYVAGLAKPDGNERKASYETGCTVTSISDAGEKGVKISWTNAVTGADETQTVDLVLGADGASSTLRRLLEPGAQRTYVGYVAWRGTVAETELSPLAADTFKGFTFYHGPGRQILGYIIPGANGTLVPGERLVNWVWYVNYAKNSLELNEVLTDSDGRRHPITLPVGGVQAKVWEAQRKLATQVLPPQYAEIVNKTRQPFVQAITDVLASKSGFWGGKVLLVGDALAGFRPHTAASTTQAAFDALTLRELMLGRIGMEEFESEVVGFARSGCEHGIRLGTNSQFGEHPFSR